MKGLSTKTIIWVICCFCLYSTAFANKNMNNNNKWVCETNASSASTDEDKKADDMMSKKAMSGKEAFSFAMKHCRDCTKITCSVANKTNGDYNHTKENNNS